MSALPYKCEIGPDGHVIFGKGGVLEPGWKAAIAMLGLEAKLASGELQDVVDDGQLPTDKTTEILARIEGCELAVALLVAQGRRIGLDV
jgi:hypothetical protein